MTTLRIFGIPVTVDHERKESFPVTGPVTLHVVTRSGNLHVVTGDVATATVHVTNSGINTEWMTEETAVDYNEATGTLTVRSPFAGMTHVHGTPLPWQAHIKGYAKRGRKWLQAGQSDVDIWVEVPRDSSVQARSVSGDAELTGDWSSLEFVGVSGNARITGNAGAVTMKTVSGNIALDGTFGILEARSVSGDIVATSVGGDVKAKSVSGDTTIGVRGAGLVTATSVSGSVHLAVRPGLNFEVDAVSRSGQVNSEIPLDAQPLDSSGGAARLSVRSVSGNITFSRL